MPLPERALIAEIRRQARLLRPRQHLESGAQVIKGIGDDCAILRPFSEREILVTTDFSLEGVHFRREWHSPESIGHRCLARGLSDIAAMGGRPDAVFLSLALPAGTTQSWVRKFVRGLTRLAGQCGVTLAGGDTAQSPHGILADIVVLGSVPKDKALLRSGARPGDRIFVTGELGGAAAAVIAMEKNPKVKPNEGAFHRHFHPEPRIEAGTLLRKNKIASAMIDTSDGLSTDLWHICEESKVGAEINSSQIPRAVVGMPKHKVSLELALHGGEDYELLFTVSPRKKVPAKVGGVKLTEIGRITARRGMLLVSENGATQLKSSGWEHFRKN